MMSVSHVRLQERYIKQHDRLSVQNLTFFKKLLCLQLFYMVVYQEINVCNVVINVGISFMVHFIVFQLSICERSRLL